MLIAAGTKWNFLHFKLALFGGHCIGVDPYYLTHKAESIGHHPEIVLAALRLNDKMGEYVASQLVKQMVIKEIQVHKSRILILGLTFKENCPDIRNTKIIEMISSLKEYDIQVDVYDPWANATDAMHEYGIQLCDSPIVDTYDGIILAVAHHQFKDMGIDMIRRLGKENSVIYD